MAQVWHLIRRPGGVPVADDFELLTLPDPELEPDMVRVENRWLSIDPYLRHLLVSEREMSGRAVGKVVESQSDAIPVGAWVSHAMGWRDRAVLHASQVRNIGQSVPAEYHLGPLSETGMSAYFGLLETATAKAGDRVFISSAAGAVGSLAVQIAKHYRMWVIGSAGGKEKCAWVRSLGADAVIDYKANGTMLEKLRAAAPDGIDVYFDNVGGDHLDAAVSHCRDGARVTLCGTIANYNESSPKIVISNPIQLMAKQVSFKGFRVHAYADRRPEFEDAMTDLLSKGAVKPNETIHIGLEETVPAFIGLFTGLSRGKPLVKL